jgi:undecaprenyl pyrophosphate phosphatase UppP
VKFLPASLEVDLNTSQPSSFDHNRLQNRKTVMVVAIVVVAFIVTVVIGVFLYKRIQKQPHQPVSLPGW